MVRPIDQRESILQSKVTEKVQQVQQRHSDIQQRYFDLQLNQEHRKRLQQVGESEKEDPVHLGEEGKRDQQDPQKREQEPRASHAADDSPAPEQTGHIDVKA